MKSSNALLIIGDMYNGTNYQFSNRGKEAFQAISVLIHTEASPPGVSGGALLIPLCLQMHRNVPDTCGCLLSSNLTRKSGSVN